MRAGSWRNSRPSRTLASGARGERAVRVGATAIALESAHRTVIARLHRRQRRLARALTRALGEASSEAPAAISWLAIGNPLGLRSSVTQGIVSSVDRMVSEGNGVTLSPAIQTSAAINPGNSGGALADLSGRVVGIPTLAALDPQVGGGPATGIGFAIPSATVRQVAPQLLARD